MIVKVSIIIGHVKEQSNWRKTLCEGPFVQQVGGLLTNQRSSAYRVSSQSTILSCIKLALYASSMLSNNASRSSKARRSAVRDDKLSGSDVGMDDPVKVEPGTRTVHLYPYLYVVFRWMRGAVPLFVSSATRKENKKG